MEAFHLIITILGGLVLVLGLGSRRLARGPFPPALLALLTGIVLGPHVLGLLDVSALGEEAVIRERVARLTLGIALIGVALRIPRRFPRERWASMLVLIVVGMPLMWAITSGLVWWILGVPFWLAAVIGAAVTPTDPVAATPIVTGDLAERHIAERLRHAISLESGLNDGAAYLLVFLGFLMLTRPVDDALSRLIVHTFLWQVCAAAAAGMLLGYAAGKLLGFAESLELIEEEWRLVYMVALALVAIGSGRLIGSDEVLVAFAAGLTFVQVVTGEDRKEEDRGQEAVNRFFVVGTFTIIGLTIPWGGWLDLGWRGISLAAAILLLRRPPVLLLLRPALPFLRNFRETVFVGWFGPVAVAALYYASLMEHRLDQPIVWEVVSLVICASAVAHGMTGAAMTRALGRTESGAGG
jgi:sodium/hydrogen antiporter